MPSLLFNVFMNAVMKEMKMGMQRRRVEMHACLLHADDLVLCDEPEEDLRAIVY